MFRLLRFLVSCALLGAFLWFATSVPLGKHTLWEHIVRIARTDEARDLAAGAKETANDVARKVKEQARAAQSPAAQTPPSPSPSPSKDK